MASAAPLWSLQARLSDARQWHAAQRRRRRAASRGHRRRRVAVAAFHRSVIARAALLQVCAAPAAVAHLQIRCLRNKAAARRVPAHGNHQRALSRRGRGRRARRMRHPALQSGGSSAALVEVLLLLESSGCTRMHSIRVSSRGCRPPRSLPTCRLLWRWRRPQASGMCRSAKPATSVPRCLLR